VLACTLPVLRRHGYGPPPVHHLGKAATFALLYAFPLLLLGEGHGVPSDLARPPGWAFAIWGAALYVWAGALYLLQVVRLLRDDNAASRAAGP
jgi:cardiolipin synthase